ncbi:hypothetical protein F4810DRAFT_686317 [Camillea tinctor]|nr:hypothetical protein F4810DRAFT_686317 [Camillea tinctor]
MSCLFSCPNLSSLIFLFCIPLLSFPFSCPCPFLFQPLSLSLSLLLFSFLLSFFFWFPYFPWGCPRFPVSFFL